MPMQKVAKHAVPYPVSTEVPPGPETGLAASTTEGATDSTMKARTSTERASLKAPLSHFRRLKSLKVRYEPPAPRTRRIRDASAVCQKLAKVGQTSCTNHGYEPTASQKSLKAGPCCHAWVAISPMKKNRTEPATNEGPRTDPTRAETFPAGERTCLAPLAII
ncbi:MAG: hypothetical protein KGI38_11515 [Thaumarchaeota archaeon]|nr:hypothetical protein [Nitrososphaerota archaeon]